MVWPILYQLLILTTLSLGSIKKGNRKSEILLREVEVRNSSAQFSTFLNPLQYVSTLASLYAAKNYEYPYDRINECWEKVCLNQCKHTNKCRYMQLIFRFSP
jgi:alpha-mannosidase